MALNLGQVGFLMHGCIGATYISIVVHTFIEASVTAAIFRHRSPAAPTDVLIPLAKRVQDAGSVTFYEVDPGNPTNIVMATPDGKPIVLVPLKPRDRARFGASNDAHAGLLQRGRRLLMTVDSSGIRLRPEGQGRLRLSFCPYAVGIQETLRLNGRPAPRQPSRQPQQETRPGRGEPDQTPETKPPTVEPKR